MTEYDTSRTVYMAMDTGTNHDTKSYNNIAKILRDNGFKVVERGLGPNIANVYGYLSKNKIKHSVALLIANGVDTTNIREALSEGDGNWTKSALKPLDNIVCLAWHGVAVDCVHEGGKGYEHLCTKQSGVGGCGGPMYNAKSKMDKAGVLSICCSNDGGANPKQEDFDGSKIAQEFLKFFDKSSNPSASSSEESESTESTENTRTVTSVVTEKTYTAPYFHDFQTAVTDHNGAFLKKIKPKYNGKYTIRFDYTGSRDYAPTSKIIEMKFHAGENFVEELIMEKITTSYSDNTTEMTSTGSINGYPHRKTVTRTQTYENNTLKSDTSVTTYSDNENDAFYTPQTTDTTTNSTTPTVTYDTGKETAITKNIGTKNGLPNLTGLGSDYEMVDEKGTYTITSEEIQRVAHLDNCCQQIYGYTPRYTFFRADGSNTKYIISREQWNVIIRAYHKYFVDKGFNEGKSPYALKISIKNKKRYYPVYYDMQNTDYTGPTSISMISQMYNNYYSEKKLSNIFGTTIKDGTDEDKILSEVKQIGLKINNISDTKESVSGSLKQGKMILWHISGHYMCVVAYNSQKDKFLCLNPSGLHKINRVQWATWKQMSNTDTNLTGVGYAEVVVNQTIPDTEKTHVKNYYTNMCGKYTVPANTENPSTNDAVTFIETKPVTNTNNTTITNGNGKNPWNNDIPCVVKGGVSVPDVASFKKDGYSFKLADENGTYTLTKEQYKEVMARDSKTMQLNNMKMSRYVMFRTKNEPNTYHILKREKWNIIEKYVYYDMVYCHGTDDSSYTTFPETITVNLAGTLNFANGYKVNVKGKNYNYWYVCNHQKSYGVTCGPTSTSTISMFLHNFASEHRIDKEIGSKHGTSAYANGLSKYHGKGVTTGFNTAVQKLKEGYVILNHGPNHYAVIHDISDDGQSVNCANPTSSEASYPPPSGWISLSKWKNACTVDATYCSPEWNISETEKTQINHLFKNLGGKWVRKQNKNEYVSSVNSTKNQWNV